MAGDSDRSAETRALDDTEIRRLTPRPGRAETFLEGLVERIGGNASAAAVYGTPVEREGVTVIPVARVRYGFGGGAGRQGSGASENDGAGMGGGVSATPVGYIEIKGGAAEFHPIKARDPLARLALVPLILAGGFTAARVLKALRLKLPRQG